MAEDSESVPDPALEDAAHLDASPRAKARRIRRSPADARGAILVAFAERARVDGIRAVVMGELARSLGMSKKTLYQHFENKDDLVRALVAEWVARIHRCVEDPSAPREDPHEVLRWWTDVWARGRHDFSAAFWSDLEHDHPQAWALFDGLRSVSTPIHARVARAMRRDVDPKLAADLYHLVVGHFNDPAVAAGLGLDTRSAVMAALEIWMGGAMRPPAVPADAEASPAPR
jgi:AcrR family transcriptional regulator